MLAGVETALDQLAEAKNAEEFGATLGGLIIGVTESLAAIYVASGLKELVVFVLFLGLLLFKPSGLLGKSRA